MTSLTSLPEVGPVLAGHLTAVGIPDAETLREVGTHEAFLRIRAQRDPGTCLSMLTGLDAAIRGVRATALPPEVKADLRAWFRGLDRS